MTDGQKRHNTLNIVDDSGRRLARATGLRRKSGFSLAESRSYGSGYEHARKAVRWLRGWLRDRPAPGTSWLRPASAARPHNADQWSVRDVCAQSWEEPGS